MPIGRLVTTRLLVTMVTMKVRLHYCNFTVTMSQYNIIHGMVEIKASVVRVS